MNLHQAVCNPHNLTCPRLEAFCGHVGLDDSRHTIKCQPLSCIVKPGERNRLSALDHLRCHMGVYAFQLRDRAIYVGKAGTTAGKRDLRERIPQHLREQDTGGTLRINWCALNQGRDFGAFETEVAQCCLWTIAFPRSRDKQTIQKITQLEHLLIGVLGPRYCDV